ncbi:MAG: GNAT family N-acetyltransferase [Desulfobaccales bacterium]
MSANVLIREAGAGDLEAVESLVKGAYLEYRELVPPELWEKWMESVSQAVHAGVGLLLVAEVAGAIKGVVQFFPDASRSGQGHWPAGSGTIRLLAVRGEARGQGLGTRLTRECLRRAQELRLPTLFLYTGRFMLAARHIYENLGFKRAPEFEPLPTAGPLAYRLDL